MLSSPDAKAPVPVGPYSGGFTARISKIVGLCCGMSYRESGGADFLGVRVIGPAANLSVQFGW